MAKTIEIGPYSAYAIAVANGFSGTEQEWLTSLIGPQGPQGASVTGAKIDASQHLIITVHDPATGGDTEIDAGEIGTTEAVQAVQQAIQQAGQSAVSAVESAGSTQQDAVASVGTQAVSVIGSAQQTAVQQVKQAGQESITSAQQEAEKAASSATQAGGSASAAASSASAAQQSQSAAASSATQADESASAAKDSENAAAASATAAAASKSNAEDAADRAEQAAQNSGLPQPTTADAGKVPTVKADGSAYELAGPYAPIAAAIRPTASGNPVSITDSVEWPLLGLKVYGKSTQVGTPSPESPVPIVSAGDAGSIGLTVSNGADLSQSMTISTPNGLPGIPVDSGGNYTDASGQQWVCDEIDFARGVYVQRVKFFTITADTDLSNNTFEMGIPKGGWVQGEYYPFFSYIGNNQAQAFPLDVHAQSKQLCNKMEYLYNIVIDASKEGFNLAPTDGSITAFRLNPDLFKDLDEAELTDVSKTTPIVIEYLKLISPIRFLYVLAEPIETPLSDEEIADYKALHTYDGTAVVSTAEDVAGLEVKYVADAQKYIDNKIQSALTPVSQAILEAITNV